MIMVSDERLAQINTSRVLGRYTPGVFVVRNRFRPNGVRHGTLQAALDYATDYYDATGEVSLIDGIGTTTNEYRKVIPA